MHRRRRSPSRSRSRDRIRALSRSRSRSYDKTLNRDRSRSRERSKSPSLRHHERRRSPPRSSERERPISRESRPRSLSPKVPKGKASLPTSAHSKSSKAADIRWDDPARLFVEDYKPSANEIPKFRAPPNRFNLQPGPEWDGIDRSNGFELKYFKKKANEAVKKDLDYQYTVADIILMQVRPLLSMTTMELHQSILEPVFAAYQQALHELHNPSTPVVEESSPTQMTPPVQAQIILSEAQRDRRTVFIQQLAVRCTGPDLTDFFNSHHCAVRQSKLVLDKYTRRSKGVAYVEFFEEESVKLALKLTGTKLFGIPIVVELTETEKNRLAEEAAAAQAKITAAAEEAFTRLYVGSLHPSLNEHDLKGVFEPFGQLISLELLKDVQTGTSKGVAYLQFARADSAKRALDALNGFELAGKKIRVGSMKK